MQKMNELETNELIKHYSDTHVKAKIRDVWKAVYVHTGEYLSGGKSILLVSDEEKHKEAVLLKDIEIDTSFPKVGIYPTRYLGKGIMLLARPATRQWKWGLCRGTTHVTNIFTTSHIFREFLDRLAVKYRASGMNNAWATWDVMGRNVNFDVHFAKEIYFPKYSTFDEAVSTLEGGITPGVAIDSDFFISVSPLHKGFLLWKWDMPVAKFEHKDWKRVEILSKPFKQEVIDFFNRRGMYGIQVS